MNWKGLGRKRLWLNLRHRLGIWVEGLTKTTKSSETSVSQPKFELVISRLQVKNVNFHCFNVLNVLNI